MNADGGREVLGVDVASDEDGAGWLAFCQSGDRRLHQVRGRGPPRQSSLTHRCQDVWPVHDQEDEQPELSAVEAQQESHRLITDAVARAQHHYRTNQTDRPGELDAIESANTPKTHHPQDLS